MLNQDIIDEDRRRAALHEAAHAVLAHNFGGGARAYIWPNPSGGSLEVRAWAGNCELWALPGSLSPGALAPRVKPPSAALALIGLAGIAAEIYDRLRDESAVFYELQAFLEVDELSPTDMALVGDHISGEMLEEVIAHVSRSWLEIEDLAAKLEQSPQSVRPRHLE